MESYIESLADTGVKQKSLTAKGTIVPSSAQKGNVMVITASYTDQGENNVKPLTRTAWVVLNGKKSDSSK
ncbi:hypothetical protein [Arenibacter nanhaiticus]|uniref:hypothetical protein n=1 Tax=Arenibacter nanhaiticus TaxID=558155 RepID=UPI00116014BA|nr:hypothetical protein [Arenibacter nanhaiticus]